MDRRQHGIKHGTLEGDLVKFNCVEAWVCTNGKWYEHCAFIIGQTARINVELGFLVKLMIAAPPLPEHAFAGRGT